MAWVSLLESIGIGGYSVQLCRLTIWNSVVPSFSLKGHSGPWRELSCKLTVHKPDGYFWFLRHIVYIQNKSKNKTPNICACSHLSSTWIPDSDRLHSTMWWYSRLHLHCLLALSWEIKSSSFHLVIDTKWVSKLERIQCQRQCAIACLKKLAPVKPGLQLDIPRDHKEIDTSRSPTYLRQWWWKTNGFGSMSYGVDHQPLSGKLGRWHHLQSGSLCSLAPLQILPDCLILLERTNFNFPSCWFALSMLCSFL